MTTIAATPVATTGLSSTLRLIGVHTKAQILDTLRTPAAIISSTVFPAMAFLFFVLPQGAPITGNPMIALTVVGQLGAFGVMAAYLFSFGIGIAEERRSPWTAYVRTLPLGSAPAIVSRVLTALFSSLCALVPLLIVVFAFTKVPAGLADGTLSWARLFLGLGAMTIFALPFLALGLIIGYTCSPKAAIGVAQVANLPLAFLGGLMLPPEIFPSWLNAVSLATPARALRDGTVQVLTGSGASALTWIVLAAWTVLLFGIAVLLQRRDEGLHYR